MTEALEVIKKYGTSGVMAIALIWFNNRLNTVEERLYDCYEQRYMAAAPRQTDRRYNEPRQVYAVVPSEIKIKKHA